MPESTTYLFDVEALDTQKGAKARVFLYNAESGSHFIDLEVPHIFPTRRLGEQTAKQIVENLQKNKTLQAAGAKIVGPIQSGREKFVVHVLGPREIKKYLPAEFVTDGRNSFENQLRWRFRTFEFPKVRLSESESQKRVIPTGQPTGLEELVGLPTLVMDWEADKEKLRKENLGFFDGDWTRLTIHAIKCGDLAEVASLFDATPPLHQREFVPARAERIRELDPAIISSYNVQYDALKPTELPNRIEVSDLEATLGKKLLERHKEQIQSRLETAKPALLALHAKLKKLKKFNAIGRQKIFEYLGLKDLPSPVRNFMLWEIAKAHPLEIEHVLAPSTKEYFPIGVDGSEPKIHAIGGFLRIPHISGRIIIDPMALAFKFYWTPNRKLETVYKFRTGKTYEKTRSYDDVQAGADAAERGDIARLEGDKKYCLEDTLAAAELIEIDTPIVFKLAQIFETSPRDAQYTSNSTLASGLRDKRFWEKYQAYRDDTTKALENFDVREEKYRALAYFGLKLETQRGLFANKGIAIFYLKTLPHVFAESVGRLTDLPSKFLRGEKNQINRMILLQTLDFLCEEALYDWNCAHPIGERPLARNASPSGARRPEPRPLGTDLFLYRHGETVELADRRLESAAAELKKLFEENGVTVVNHTDRFLFLQFETGKNATYNEKLARLNASKYMEFYTTSDKVLSGSKGRAIALAGGMVVSPGVDLKGRYGLRTQFEKDIFALFESYIEGKIKTHELIAQSDTFFKNLAAGQITKEDLVYMAGANFELEELTRDGARQQRYKLLAELVESGAVDGIAGKKTAFGYAFGGTLHSVLSANDFLKDETKIDYERYCEGFFGKKTEMARRFPDGTISDYFYSLIPSGKHEVREMLARFFEGQASQNDLERIVALIPKNAQTDLGKFD